MYGKRENCASIIAINIPRLQILAKLLQKFDLSKDDPSYELKLRSDLSVKPDGFYMQVKLRGGLKATHLSATADTHRGNPGLTRDTRVQSLKPSRVYGAPKGQPIMILHGSNTGTCEALASVLASTCVAKGFAPHVVDTLDSGMGQLSAETPIIMIAASYNGLPASNSAEMVAWLEKMASQPGALADLRYAVFGCGHSDWKDTYQKVPVLLHQLMKSSGAKPLVPMGASDAATGDVFSDFADWYQEHLLPALFQEYNMKVDAYEGGATPCSSLSISMNHPTRVQVRPGYFPAVVTEQKQLSHINTDATIPTKHHIELRFPGDAKIDYAPGDHLLVLPRNNPQCVNTLLDRLGMAWDTQVTIGSGRALGVQDGTRLSAAELLGAYVELPITLTSKHLRTLAAATRDDEFKSQLTELMSDHAPSLSLTGLLELLPAFTLTLPAILQIAAPMRPRTYSISSAPATKPGHGTLTVSAVRGGIASNYLANVGVGHAIYGKVNSNPALRVTQPRNQEMPPLIMIAVGSGLAPFRAVIQDLVMRFGREHDNSVERCDLPQSQNHLFYGCRGRSIDEMYVEELDEAERMGVVTVRRAYSREGAAQSSKYVTDVVAGQTDLILDLWKSQGAVIRVCAGKKLADEVWQLLGPLIRGASATAESLERERNMDGMMDLTEWRQKLAPNSGSRLEGRYVEEVYS